MKLGIVGRILTAILGPIPDGDAERYERAMMRRRDLAAAEMIAELERYQATDNRTHPVGHD